MGPSMGDQKKIFRCGPSARRRRPRSGPGAYSSGGMGRSASGYLASHCTSARFTAGGSFHRFQWQTRRSCSSTSARMPYVCLTSGAVLLGVGFGGASRCGPTRRLLGSVGRAAGQPRGKRPLRSGAAQPARRGPPRYGRRRRTAEAGSAPRPGATAPRSAWASPDRASAGHWTGLPPTARAKRRRTGGTRVKGQGARAGEEAAAANAAGKDPFAPPGAKRMGWGRCRGRPRGTGASKNTPSIRLANRRSAIRRP